MSQGQRRLAAIMYTDMVGYTALGQRNESLSLALVDEQRKLIRLILRRHDGREVKTMGDAFLVEFPSALEAVRCAYDIQRATREFNVSIPEERRIHLRVGIHLGDVVESGGDISGDAVNVASRIEPLAEDGGVCLTRQVFDHVQNKFELPLSSVGFKELKNVAAPVEVYKIMLPWVEPTISHDAGPPANRVAILPFSNISPDPNDGYIADGLTEELISTLSKIGELSVISSTSTAHYKDKSKPIGEIARELKAGTILEGSVRKAGNMIRVTIQMIEAPADRQVWAESYDRELRDIFAIQSDIAERVTSALRVKLASAEKRDIEKRPTESMDAYQLYLRGLYHLHRETREDYAKALGYFEEAIGLDHRFALAYAGISDYYHFTSHLNWFKPEDAFPKMKDFAMKAVEIDPRLAEAHASLGAVYFHYEWKWREAEKEFARARELKPSYAPAYSMNRFLLAVLGKYEESYEFAKREADLSPQYRSQGMGLAGALMRLGRIEEGVERLKEGVRTDPDFVDAHDALAFAYYAASEPQQAVSEMRKAVALSKDELFYKGDLALMLALTGSNEEATTILGELVEASKTAYVSDVQMGCILYSLGRQEEAFSNLERAFERKAIDLPDIRLMPWMRQLRADPRWGSIESRMGLSKLASGPGLAR